MAGSKWYFYPDGDGELQTIDMGFYARDIDAYPARRAKVVTAGLGAHRTYYGANRWIVPVMLEIGDDETLAEKMLALESHLKRGQPVSFAFDQTKAFAGLISGVPVRGATTLNHEGNAFFSYESIVNPSAGDRMILQSAPPESRYEVVRVSSLGTGYTITIDEALYESFTEDPCILRHKHFHPYLVLADGWHDKQLLTSDHGVDLVFKAVFWEDSNALHNIDEANVGSVGVEGEASNSLGDMAGDILPGAFSIASLVR